MINMRINDKVYFIPENWGDITIDRFITYYQNNFKLMAQDISDKPEYDEINYINIISIITLIPEEILVKLDIKHIKTINNALGFLKTDIPSKTKINIEAEYNNEKIRLKLKDFKNLTLSDVSNIEILTDRKDPILVLPSIIAILYVSENEGFNNLSLDERSFIIANTTSIDGIMGLPSFFFLSLKILDKNIQTYTTLKTLRGWRKTRMKLIYRWDNTITHWRLVYQNLYWRLRAFFN